MLKFYLFIFTLFSLIILSINGYYLSIDTHEEKCFFERVEEKSNIGVIFEVTDGGFLDIDYKIVDPNNFTVIKGEHESSGKHTIISQNSGIYSICFSNMMSSKAPKILYFNIYVKTNDRKNNDNNIDPVFQKTEDMIKELLNSLISVKREQEYLMIRGHVHEYINKNTNKRIGLWAIFEFLLLLIITFGQIIYLKKFFEVKRII